MTSTEEIVALLSTCPMIAVGLASMSEYQYELLMLKVRAELIRRVKS